MRIKIKGEVNGVLDNLSGISAISDYGPIKIQFESHRDARNFMDHLNHLYKDNGPENLPERYFGKKLVKDHNLEIRLW